MKLGKVQTQIMRFLWEREAATAREITGHLSKTQAIAHSTVQTLLRKLEAKGAVRHEDRERVFYFHAAVPESQIAESSIQDLVTRAFQGSVAGLVTHLIKSEQISPAELNELRRLIDEHQEQPK